MDNKLASGMKSLLTIAKNAATGVDQSVPNDVKKERLDICLACTKFISLTKQCGECFCIVTAKTGFKQESCPLGKWGKYEEAKEETNELL